MQRRLRNKKLSLALTIIFLCSILFGTFPLQPACAQFSDIKGNWAEKQINDWADRGLAGGYTDGTFRPDNQITRAEFVALTNRAFGKQDKTARADFKDVKKSEWFYAEVAVAKAEGYCAGYTDGTFKPLNPITRQEVASIVSRLLELDAGTIGKNFADAESIAPWARDAVKAVAAAGIMSGYTDGTFQGANPITRAEAVVTLDRAISTLHQLTTNKPAAASEGITGIITVDGKAVEGAVVLLFEENGTEPMEETTSGKDGKYTFLVAAGTYDITAAKDSNVAYASSVSFVGDGVVQDLVLNEGTLICGRLADQNGSAVKNAKLFFTTNPTFLTTTDNTGEFSVYVPAGKKYTIRGYKNNKPASGLEILADNIEAGNAGTQSIGNISTSYTLATSSGGGGGGGDTSTGTVATPTASPAPGAVQASTEVTIGTTTTGATIYYTTDGSEPTTKSTRYSAPITITEAVTIKAKAFKSGWNASSTATFSYTVISEAVPVTAITVTGEEEATTVVAGESLQMAAAVEPANATDPSVNWSVEAGTGTATIDANGLMTGTSAGTVTVRATANDGSGVDGTALITVVEPDPFVGGDGSVENPYQVATAEQLDKVREHLDRHFIQIADIDLGVAPWNEGEGWEPIGTEANPFYGTYDGAGHQINSLTVNRPAESYLGLFGYITGKTVDEVMQKAVIENVRLNNVEITGQSFVGSLVGHSNYNSEINDCTADAVDLVCSNLDWGQIFGGLVGRNNGTVTGCQASGTILGPTGVGGLVGTSNNGNISTSHADVEISGRGWLGGLVGNNSYANIDRCYALGNVSGWYGIGGLVGQHYSGNIVDTYATGSVTSHERTMDCYVGGLIGMIGPGTVQNSYAVGAVSATGTPAGDMHLGGLVGKLPDVGTQPTFTSCYYDQEAAGQTDTGKGIPKTSAEMAVQSTFENWDFNTIWTIDQGVSYPYLQRQTENIPYPPSPFAGGLGTPDNPYEVATAEQLDRVRDYRDKHFIQVEDIDLGVSPWNDGEGWEPIGGYLDADAFNGSYDGNGYVIRNLRVVRTGNTYSSLFGRVKYPGILASIKLEDVSVSGGDGTGGLAGYVEGATISDSYVTGTVSGTGYYTGGLVGTLSSSTINNSHSTATVTGNDRYTGGLVGATMNGTSVTNSYASGYVSGNICAGGLAGSNGNDCTISQSYTAAASVTGNTRVGGLAGQNTGSISGSHSSGAVSSNNRAGGLVGFNDSDGEIGGSYSTCEVTVSGYNPEMIGGLVGYNNGLISECYAAGDVIDVYAIVGGLVGYNYLGTISNCYALGDVSGTSRVGGLVGDSRQTITDSYASGSVSGSSGVGGLVGLLEGTVSNSYASGSVSGTNLLGGLVGQLYGEGVVSNSYYDAETTGQSDTGKGVPKTTAEMVDQNIYSGWDFGSVWTIDTDPASYPYLQWQTGNIPLAEFTRVTLGDSVMTRVGNPGQNEINAISYSNSSNAYMNDGTLNLLFSDGDINITVSASVYRPEGTILAAERLTQALNANEVFSPAYEAANNSSGYIVVTNRIKEDDKQVTMQFSDPDNTGVMFDEYGSQVQPGYAPQAGISTTPVLTGSSVSETIQIRVTQYQLDKVVPVAVFAHDSAVTVAERIRAALAADTDISEVLIVSTSGTEVILTQREGNEINCTIQS